MSTPLVLRTRTPRGNVSGVRTPSFLRIAFGGTMQVGKTTAADHLVRRYGFVKFALADPIKQIARRYMGWDGAKDARGRRLLQQIGTVGREYDPEVWLDHLAARLDAAGPVDAVVDDLRLPHEVVRLRRYGFTCVRVTRPPERIPAAPETEGSRHETETGLDALELDHVVANDGSFEELYARLDRLVASLREASLREGETERPRHRTGPSARARRKRRPETPDAS